MPTGCRARAMMAAVCSCLILSSNFRVANFVLPIQWGAVNVKVTLNGYFSNKLKCVADVSISETLALAWLRSSAQAMIAQSLHFTICAETAQSDGILELHLVALAVYLPTGNYQGS